MNVRERMHQEVLNVSDHLGILDGLNMESASSLKEAEDRATKIKLAAERMVAAVVVRQRELGHGHYERRNYAYPQAQVGASFYKDAPEVPADSVHAR